MLNARSEELELITRMTDFLAYFAALRNVGDENFGCWKAGDAAVAGGVCFPARYHCSRISVCLCRSNCQAITLWPTGRCCFKVKVIFSPPRNSQEPARWGE